MTRRKTKVSTKQARTLSDKQQEFVLKYLKTTRYPDRNRVIFMLSVKCALRACEMAGLCWFHVLNNEGDGINTHIRVTDDIAKSGGGRVFKMNKEVVAALQSLYDSLEHKPFSYDRVALNQSGGTFSPNGITQLFRRWYNENLMWEGYSSHSGRRTAITNMARNIVNAKGSSLYDVQMIAGHAALSTTQIYIEPNAEAQAVLVDLI